MFATGKIILDKTGAARRFQQESIKIMRKKFRKSDKVRIEVAKYTLWDQLDDMRDIEDHKSPDFLYLYYLQLESILSIYTRFLGAEIPARAKLIRFLTDRHYRNRYDIAQFPDSEFVEYFKRCLRKADFERLKQLTNYVLDKMGGFDIDGWKLRTPVEQS